MWKPFCAMSCTEFARLKNSKIANEGNLSQGPYIYDVHTVPKSTRPHPHFGGRGYNQNCRRV